MKKIITLILFAGFFSVYCNAQNIIQISNDGNKNNNNQQKECEYKINGICSSEDIGGVEVEFHNECSGTNCTYMTLKNYNKFMVTVVWKVNYSGPRDFDDKIGTTVIEANSEKKVYINGGRVSDNSLEGIIVRKLSK